MTFEDLKFNPTQINSGIQAIVKFENNYGASVVKHEYSYGGKQGLYELAVIQYDESSDWDICYDTPITDDVLGHLSESEVNEYVDQVIAL